jgi:hypothetical protein
VELLLAAKAIATPLILPARHSLALGDEDQPHSLLPGPLATSRKGLAPGDGELALDMSSRDHMTTSSSGRTTVKVKTGTRRRVATGVRVAVPVVACSGAAPASASTQTFTPLPSRGPGFRHLPYCVAVPVLALGRRAAGAITDVNVTLYRFSDTDPADVDMLIVAEIGVIDRFRSARHGFAGPD